MIFVKSVGVEPLPNRKRHPWAGWDAYVQVPDPDALAAEFTSRGVTFSVPLKDTNDGLRGFELEDADGYVFRPPSRKFKLRHYQTPPLLRPLDALLTMKSGEIPHA